MFTDFVTPFQDLPGDLRFVPSFNRVLIRCLSDQALNFNFKYVVTLIEYDFPTDIEVATIATLRFDPLPDVTAPIEFDISRLINTEFKFDDVLSSFYDPSTMPSVVLGYTNQITRGIKIKINEEWKDETTGEIVEPGVEVEDVFKVFPGAFPVLKNAFFDPAYFTGVSPLALNSLSTQTEIFLDYYGFKNFCFFDPQDKLTKFRAFVEHTDGTTGFQEFVPTNQASSNRDVAIFTFSPSYLTTSGFPKSIALFVVYDGIFESRVATIEVSPCLIEQNTKTELWRRLYWLNEFGTFDTMLFAANSRKSFDTKRESYQRTYSGTGIQIAGAGLASGDFYFANTSPVFFNETREKLQVVSNWLTDNQSKNLKNLFASSLVYVEEYIDESSFQGTIKVPVKVVSSNYVERNIRTEKNIQVQIDLEFCEPQFRQII